MTSGCARVQLEHDYLTICSTLVSDRANNLFHWWCDRDVYPMKRLLLIPAIVVMLSIPAITSGEFDLQGLNDQVQHQQTQLNQQQTELDNHQAVLDNHEVRITNLENKQVNNEETAPEEITPSEEEPTTTEPTEPSEGENTITQHPLTEGAVVPSN